MVSCVPIVVTSTPLLWSSTFWTFHNEWTTLSTIAWWILAVTQLFVVILFAMWQPEVRSFPLRCLDVVSLLVVVVVFPVIISTLIRFWLVRPDSWELLQWRLQDDWNKGLFLGQLRQSVCLMVVTFLLWSWALISKRRLAPVRRRLAALSKEKTLSTEKTLSKKLDIQSLMMTTTLVAVLASSLLRLDWQPGILDLTEVLQAIPIALTVAAIGACVHRHAWRLKLLALAVASVGWGIVAIANAVLIQQVYEMTMFPTESMYLVLFSATWWAFVSLVAWLLLRWRGLRMVKLGDER